MLELIYPFGSKLKPVVQKDRSPKKVFVLGVYASAVHARWYGPDGKIRVRALAVASEPEIFWRYDKAKAEEIISRIAVPPGCGYLVPEEHLNGPSGKVLDEKYLEPLGYSTRKKVWLCDLLPETRLNGRQRKAIENKYDPLVEKGLVPEVTIPSVERRFSTSARRQEIATELIESKADLLITLGDDPLREFVAQYKRKWNRLSFFGDTEREYGRKHELTIGGRTVSLLPLVHPRQAGRLGAFSIKWAELHDYWVAHERKKLR